MKHSKFLFISVFTFFALGMVGLSRFSGNVRTVNIVGLFFSGALCGAALVNLITAFGRESKAKILKEKNFQEENI